MFRAFRSEVEDVLEAALLRLELPSGDLGVERPPPDRDAALASSVSFRLASEAEATPSAIANDIAAAIEITETRYIASVDVAGPYVNFSVSERFYAETLNQSVSSDYGSLSSQNTSIIIEHTSANPTGPIHVGRARNTIFGDSLARLLEYAGYDVERQYYVNDAGRQMALFTWAYETFDEADLPPPERARSDYELVRYYRKGNRYLENADEAATEVAESEIASIIDGLDRGDMAVYERVERVVDSVLEGMQQSLSRLPVAFDQFVKETRFIRNGTAESVIERLQSAPESIYEDGAWQLDLSGHDIDKRLVFVRSDGTSLYTTRDLAYHEWKLQNFDRAVTVLGEDHKLQAEQLDAALSILDVDTDSLDQTFYSYVNLPDGRMSTREGTGVDLDDLLDEAVKRARSEVTSRVGSRERDDELTQGDIDRIARQVGIGAVRYDIISKQPTKGITFEWERALDFEAQSAPYIQYVHARCCGIQSEARAQEISPDARAELLVTAPERALLDEISRLPLTVEAAADELAPHMIATYLRSIAETFNTFYRECSVLSAETTEVSQARLALVGATANAIENALDILGIEAPRSM
jgi:arginyl-tRNA synthetase